MPATRPICRIHKPGGASLADEHAVRRPATLVAAPRGGRVVVARATAGDTAAGVLDDVLELAAT